jgi:hypothetical protein
MFFRIHVQSLLSLIDVSTIVPTVTESHSYGHLVAYLGKNASLRRF